MVSKKYKLRKGEKLIKEYVDNDGKPVIIFEDEDGVEMHGWILDLDDDVARLVHYAAAAQGMDTEEYVNMILGAAISRMNEEREMKQAIEEISD